MVKFSASCLVMSLMFAAGRSHVVDYLLSYPRETTIRAVAGYSGGWYQVQSQPRVNVSNYGHVNDDIHESYPLVADHDNQTILMIANHVYLYVGTGDSIYSPLRTYANGKKYIVSSCTPPTGYHTLLVVATHSYQAEVTITFKVDGTVTYNGNTYGNGEILSVSLAANRTFSMESDKDLTGTVVSATETVAVFSGSVHNVEMKHIVAYEQLLPVMHYGTEYVVAVDDHSSNYTLKVLADSVETDLQFKGGNTSKVAKGSVHERTMTSNEALHFTSTQPVMATLCRLNDMKTGFTVVPPVAFYATSKSLYVDQGDTAKILTMKTEMDPRMQVNETAFVDFVWTAIPDSDYQVGTLDFPEAGSYGTINSNYSFIVFVYGENRIYNAGSSIPQPVTETSESTTTMKATTEAVSTGNRINGVFTLFSILSAFLLYQLW